MLRCWGWDIGVWVWGLAVGPTAALRLGTWGAVGGMLGRRRRRARAAFAVRGGARRQLCEVRQHRGRRRRGVCVARVFHVKHGVKGQKELVEG